MRKRRQSVASVNPRPRTTRRNSAATVDGALITRPRRDPFDREWVVLSAEARALGIDDRTLRKHLAGEPFVRVLGDRWYVQHVPFREWWERQRPIAATTATSKRARR